MLRRDVQKAKSKNFQTPRKKNENPRGDFEFWSTTLGWEWFSPLIDLVLNVQKWSAQSSNSHGGKVWCWEIPEIESGWHISYEIYNPFISWFFRKFSKAPKWWTEFVRASNLHIKQIHGYSWRVTFDGGKSLKITLNNLNGFKGHPPTPHPTPFRVIGRLLFVKVSPLWWQQGM